MKVYIYVFLDDSGCPRYVGKTKNLDQRIKQHINRERFRYKSHFYNWLNKVFDECLPYFVDVLEVTDEENWQDKEKHWIKYFRDNEFPITNMTDGGDGNNNQVFSRESIEKRNAKLRGVPRPDWVRKKISESHKGKKLSKETKEKLRQHNLGRKVSDKVRLKTAKAVLQFELDGTFIKEWPSISDAARALNISKSLISSAARGKTKTCNKQIWKFKN